MINPKQNRVSNELLQNRYCREYPLAKYTVSNSPIPSTDSNHTTSCRCRRQALVYSRCQRARTYARRRRHLRLGTSPVVRGRPPTPRLLHQWRAMGRTSRSKDNEGREALTAKHRLAPRPAYITPPSIAPSPNPRPPCNPDTAPWIVVRK